MKEEEDDEDDNDDVSRWCGGVVSVRPSAGESAFDRKSRFLEHDNDVCTKSVLVRSLSISKLKE